MSLMLSAMSVYAMWVGAHWTKLLLEWVPPGSGEIEDHLNRKYWVTVKAGKPFYSDSWREWITPKDEYKEVTLDWWNKNDNLVIAHGPWQLLKSWFANEFLYPTERLVWRKNFNHVMKPADTNVIFPVRAMKWIAEKLKTEKLLCSNEPRNSSDLYG